MCVYACMGRANAAFQVSHNTPCNAISRYNTPCNAISRYNTPCNAIRRYNTLCNAYVSCASAWRVCCACAWAATLQLLKLVECLVAERHGMDDVDVVVAKINHAAYAHMYVYICMYIANDPPHDKA